MTGKILSGACYCGAVKYRINGDFRSQCFCHCRSCRLVSGAPFVAWGTIDTPLFEITQGFLSEISSSPGVIRGFCGRCGTGLTYTHEKRPAEIDITLATLDDAGQVRPEYHLWISDKLPWVIINDGLPQYQEWRSVK